MIKQYQDVKVSDLQCIYKIFGDEVSCDADSQRVTIDSFTYEWLLDNKKSFEARL